MPVILLPPFGGDKRGGMCYTLIILSTKTKRGETTHALLEFIDNYFIRNYKKKL